MASALVSNPYGQPAYGYVQQHQAPQPPPSPPMDESKCSLPSISNLLGLADAGSPTSETSPQNQQSSPVPQHQPAPQQAASPAPSRPETRPSSAHYSQPTMLRGGMPPTPPMSSEASFDGYPSPATKSVSGLSVVSGHNYYYETTPPLEEPRHMTPVMQQRMPVQTSYPQQSFTGSPYMTQPTLASYYPPMQPTPPPPQPQISGLYYQRPLPQQFPPMGHHHAHAVSVGLGGHPHHHHHASGSANPWQHHHYISPQSAASFPQSQDRYICQTCNKAFSRPSSLRIHSHSHTGEKPFKCPHPGCGKAFSVRSNMKRHERGCHNFESTTSSPLVS